MMRISASAGDLSDSHLRRITQLGVGAVDFGKARDLPSVRERGYPDLDALIEIKKRVRSWGLDVNRGTLPAIIQEFMRGEAGTERELDDAVQSLRVFGDAGMTLASQRFEGSNSNHLVTFYRSEHRGGYIGSGASAWHRQAAAGADAGGPGVGVGRRSRRAAGQGRNPGGGLSYGTARPAVTPVHCSRSTATLPLTSTYGIPRGNWRGSSYVAVSMTRSGSKTTRSA